MKKTTVTIPWEGGLHLRPASRLVRLARGFQSRLTLRLGVVVADATSILSLLLLAAGTSVAVEVEAAGPDEQEAISAVVTFFQEAEEAGYQANGEEP